jgi:SAM-dependent methyltransferase
MWKRLARELTPPLLWRAGARLVRPLRGAAPDGRSQDYAFGVEQPPAYYDATFREAAHWRLHYTASGYFPLWTVVADRARRAGLQSVLDVGCGPGQVACLLRDRGLVRYHGVDFSPERVAAARAACPQFTFSVADVFAPDTGGPDVLAESDYDGVLVMEFLEHVDRDCEVLARVRPGAHVLATVPNFPAAGHVRHFGSSAEVAGRYGPLLDDADVVAIQTTEAGKTYYLLEGTARAERAAR